MPLLKVEAAPRKGKKCPRPPELSRSVLWPRWLQTPPAPPHVAPPCSPTRQAPPAPPGLLLSLYRHGGNDPRTGHGLLLTPRLWAPAGPAGQREPAISRPPARTRSVLSLMTGSLGPNGGAGGGRSRPSRSRARLSGGCLACVIHQEFQFSPPRGWKKKQ